MARLLRSVLAVLALPALAPASALAADTPAPPPTEPGTHATLLWAALQLVPSPEVVIGEGPVRFGARWQLTPLLYSFGIHRRLSPWRSFVVEPIVRHAGSIELHFFPEVLTGGFPTEADRWLLRFGLRSYLPLIDRGEALSCSLGSSLIHLGSRNGVSLDAGLTTLAGLFGLRVSHGFTPGLRLTTLALEIRVF